MENLWSDIWINIQSYYDNIVTLMPKLFLAFVILILTIFFGRLLKSFAKKRINHRADDPLLANFLGQIVKGTVYIIGFVIMLGVIGLGEAAGKILAGAGITAFVIGFAFKDIGENFLAGMLMAFNRPFKIGDTVETNGQLGSITSMNLRETLIKSFDGKDIYIPNGQILKNPLLNYTRDGFLRRDFSIGLDYEDDMQKAIQITLAALGKVNGILKEEKMPSIRIGDLEKSRVRLNVLFWIDTFNKERSGPDIETDAKMAVIKALSEAGFYLPADIIELKNYQKTELATKGSDNAKSKNGATAS